MRLAEHVNFSREDYSGAVILHGETNDARRAEISSQVSVECVSLEVKQQLADQITKQALANLYTVTPKQSGFELIASATKAAIRNPQNTIITVLRDEDGVAFTDDQNKSVDQMLEILRETGAQVFENSTDAANYINGLGAGNGLS